MARNSCGNDADDRRGRVRAKSSSLCNPEPTIVARFDDRIPVAGPGLFPNRCVGQIVVRTRNPTGTFLGSGSLVSDYTVLTAGHNFKNEDDEFFDIQSIRFIPAKNHASEPYGQFDWDYIQAIRIDNRDWALMSLTQGAGFSVGFLGSVTKFPISRWMNEGDRFSHVGFPGDHRDEMWIDEDGRVTDIFDDCQLETDIDAAHGQSGGPLALGWTSETPRVVASLIRGPNAVEEPNFFMPGWEDVKEDTWFDWLCNVFSKRHPDDRFGGCQQSALGGGSDRMFADGKPPDYTQNHRIVDDDGPLVRRFYPGDPNTSRASERR